MKRIYLLIIILIFSLISCNKMRYKPSTSLEKLKGSIEGYVFYQNEFMKDKEIVVGAYIVGAGTTWGAETNEFGYYNIRPGLYNIYASHIGLANQYIYKFEVKAGFTAIQDFVLDDYHP